MLTRVPFHSNEITDKFVQNRMNRFPVFNYPISPLENWMAMSRGEAPLWMPMTSDYRDYDPRIDPDNIARGNVFDADGSMDPSQFGGPDIFGVVWDYIPQAGGSMVRPGTPLLKDANDWERVLKFPDIDSWDWAGSAQRNRQMFEENKDYFQGIILLNGFLFERLISFMDFEGAALAIIDEDQKEAVKAMCTAILERVYFPYLDHIKKYYPLINRVFLHDDWGGQRAPFFSLHTVREMFVPIMRRFADRCEELGLVFELHSCGLNEMLVPGYIEGGVKTWNGMDINNKKMLYEQYGDKIILGVDPPKIATDPKATKEQIEAAAKEVCQFYIRDGKCHVVASLRRVVPYYVQCLYQYSRQMLNP